MDIMMDKMDGISAAEKIREKDPYVKLVFASSHTKDCPYAVKKCVHYINTNLHNRLSLDILAKECGISPDYLSVIFKKYMKLSVSQYIKKQRLYTACMDEGFEVPP